MFEAGRIVSTAGESYPLVDGKPILVRTILAMLLAVPPGNNISRNIGD